MHSRVAEILSPAERIGFMKLGAYARCVQRGVPIEQLDAGGSEKQAEIPFLGPLLSSFGTGLEGVAKLIVATSVLGGVPLGIAAHALGRSITKDEAREKELKTEAGYYRNAAHQMEQALQPGAVG